MIRITDIKLEVGKAPSLAIEKENLLKYIMTQYRINDKDIKSFSIYKKAIDARKKDQIYFVYSVDLKVKNEKIYLDKKMKGLMIAPIMTYQKIPSGYQVLNHRPVVIGFGPSGIFAALLLARRGYKPIVLERGFDVDQRSMNVEHFYQTGEYSEGATILFGEGAGYAGGIMSSAVDGMKTAEKIISRYKPN